MANGTSEKDGITVNLKSSLLSHLDRYCERRELSRSQVVSIAVKRLLASEMADDPAFWDALYRKYEEEGKF